METRSDYLAILPAHIDLKAAPGAKALDRSV
jgi:hypothetical protein